MAIVIVRAVARWLRRAGASGDAHARAADLLDAGDVVTHASDPLAALRALRDRVAPTGVLRVRALPRWHHARDAQLRRVAALLGIDAATPRGAASLRRVVARLQPTHPLRVAFASHAQRVRGARAGRTVTATELAALLARAGLEPVRWLVPDPARPDAAAARLRLDGRSDAFVLGYLDLWQQLRAPLVVDARPTPGARGQRPCFRAEADFVDHVGAVRVGARAPNPLYAHLFAAFELAARHPELGLPDLEDQIGRWLPWAAPLEHGRVRFGLTPYATFLRLRVNVLEHVARTDFGVAPDWAGVRLRDDGDALLAARALLVDCGVPAALDDAALRELHVLLQTHDRLLLTLRPA